jgi:nicotinate phosphoribosyltransferase
LQVRRFHMGNENVADVIYDIYTPWKGDCQIVDPLDPIHVRKIKKEIPSKDLLEPIFRQGKCIYQQPSLQDIRQHTQQELKNFNVGIKRFLNPHLYVVGMEKKINDLKITLIKQNRQLSSNEPNHFK